MDILPASTKSDWWTVLTDNNPIKGSNLQDGINLPAFEKLQAQLDKAKTVPEQIGLWQMFLKNPANINDAGMPIAKKALNTWMTDGKMPSNVQAVLSKDPFATLPPLAQAQLIYDKTDPASVKNYATALKDTYGNLKKADGTKEFTSAYLDSVAAGTIPQDTFDTRINNIAVKAATADLKAQGISLDDVGGAEGLASSGKLAEYLNDSTKLASAYTSTPTSGSTVVGGPVTTGNGITGLLPKGSYKDANGNFAYTGGQIDSKDMAAFTQSYNPNKGVYRAPTLDASGKLVSNPTSPYSNILNGMLSNYKDPFASGYTNQLTMPETPDLTNIKKPFTTNATASDLVKLANSAGGEYDPTNKAGSTLPPALHQLYQNQTLPDDTVKAKPGVPDPTKMKVPEANFLDLNGDLLYGDIAGGDLTNTPMGGDAKTATESAYGFTPDTTLKDVPGATITDESGTLTKPVITDKATADALHKAEQDRIAKEAADKAEAAKQASYYNADGTLTGLGFYTFNPTGNYQDYLGKIAADKAAADTDTGGIKTLADKAAADKIIADKAAADKAIADKAIADKAIADKAAADKAIADKEQAEATAEWEFNSNKAREETAAWWKAAAEREAADKAAADKIIADKAAADKAAAEQLAPIPKTDAQLLGTKWTSADIDSGELTFDELNRLRELNSAASKTNGTKSLDPYTTMDATGWTPEQLAPKGAVGIAGNPNVGSFTSADNMNTSATGVGAPITSLLTPNTGASGTPTVIQQQDVANEPDTGGIKTLADKAAADKAIADKAAADKAAADKAAADKAAADKAAADKEQAEVTYPYPPISQQQLEDKAVNAGYQGDYTDTAAMQSFINGFYK